MDHHSVLESQREFFHHQLAGCAFAAFAAKEPERYGWVRRVVEPTASSIEAALVDGCTSDSTTMMSIVLPEVADEIALVSLLSTLKEAHSILLGQDVVYDGFRCLGYRLQIGERYSWITGFGPFAFLPLTRQSPYTEITVRVKPRPNYRWNFKEVADDVIHLADLDMKGLPEKSLRKLWDGSITATTRVLGHPANLCSAAKTTYAVPSALAPW